MTEVSIVPEVWARLADPCSGSLWASVTVPLAIVAAIIAAKCIRYAWQQLWLYEAAHRVLAAQGIPRAPSGNPFAPDAPWKREDLHRVGQDDCEKLGGIFYFRILWFNCVQISNPWLMHEVLAIANEHPEVIDKPRGFPLPIYDCFDRGTSSPAQPCLISTKSADPWHKKVRRGVYPAFSTENIRNSFDAVLEVAERLCARLWEAGPDQAVDIDGALQCQAFDVIGRVGFMHDYNATADLSGPGAACCRTIKEGCAIGVNDMRNPVRPMLRCLPFLPEAWTHRQKVKRVQTRLLSMLHSLAKEVQARGKQDLKKDASIGNHLMQLHQRETDPLPFTRMWSETSIFFMAGMETTAHAITWALYLVSQHPEVEAKIVAELDAAGLLVTAQRPQPRKLTREDALSPQRLPYLKAVLKEVQRMYSVAPLVVRKALQDVHIGQYTIPAGTVMILHIFAMHNTSANFERHTEFLPDRWLEADADRARPIPGTSSACHAADTKVKRFLPFLAGNRSCIGMELAKLNYTTAVASLLSRFSFRLSEDMGGAAGVRAKEVYFVTIQPKECLNMYAVPR